LVIAYFLRISLNTGNTSFLRGYPEKLVFSGIAPEIAKLMGFASAEFSCNLAG
jgi:hypothetical protein